MVRVFRIYGIGSRVFPGPGTERFVVPHGLVEPGMC